MGRVSSAWPSPRPAATRLKCQPMKSNKATVKVMTPKADRAQVDQSIAPLVKQILERLGEDTGREGLARTPERWRERAEQAAATALILLGAYLIIEQLAR